MTSKDNNSNDKLKELNEAVNNSEKVVADFSKDQENSKPKTIEDIPKIERDLNNVIVMLTQLSKVSKELALQYSSITEEFKGVSKVADNIIQTVAINLKERGFLTIPEQNPQNNNNNIN